jgi:hypothetical protein
VSFTTWKDGAVAILYGQDARGAGEWPRDPARTERRGAERGDDRRRADAGVRDAGTRAGGPGRRAMTDDQLDRRSPWTPFLVRLIVALIILTPFVAIILQALGKR